MSRSRGDRFAALPSGVRTAVFGPMAGNPDIPSHIGERALIVWLPCLWIRRRNVTPSGQPATAKTPCIAESLTLLSH